MALKIEVVPSFACLTAIQLIHSDCVACIIGAYLSLRAGTDLELQLLHSSPLPSYKYNLNTPPNTPNNYPSQ